MKSGWRNASFSFWLLIAFLSLVALTGGSARSDVQSLAILRPVSVIIFGIALINFKFDYFRAHALLFGIIAAIWMVAIGQLIPLPPALWQGFPSRELVIDIGAISGQESVYRTLSLDPEAAWNALFSLFIPTTVLLLGLSISSEERYLLLFVIMCFAISSGLWGLFQSIGSPESSLFYYRITNNGAAVGFFANRNHQAFLLVCLFPMLATFASTAAQSGHWLKIFGGLAIGVGAVAVPLLLVTGSRAGLVMGVLSFLAALILYWSNAAVMKKIGFARKSVLPIAIGVGAFLIGGATIWLSRAEAVSRLASSTDDGDLRFEIWLQIWRMASNYSPLGTGVGSFSTVFKSDEPNGALRLNYVNQAHNDYLDTFLTSGFPGILLLAVASLYLGRAALSAFRAPNAGRNGPLAKLGAVIVAIYAAGSLVDYPLRVPFSAVLFCIALIWMTTYDKKYMEIAGRA